jgi:hypothetical protein
MNPPPEHHKEIARHLRERFGGSAKVAAYRDDDGKRPIVIGEFGEGKNRAYSTIGLLDDKKSIPEGGFEFAAFGSQPWLPNALVSSIYWLRNRGIEGFPLFCEDAIKINTRSPYRHMAFVPSAYSLRLTNEKMARWLLGIPLRDSEISLSSEEIEARVRMIFPNWLTEE